MAAANAIRFRAKKVKIIEFMEQNAQSNSEANVKADPDGFQAGNAATISFAHLIHDTY